MAQPKSNLDSAFSFDENSESVPSVTALIKTPSLGKGAQKPASLKPDQTRVFDRTQMIPTKPSSAPVEKTVMAAVPSLNETEKTNIRSLAPSLLPASKRSSAYTLQNTKLKDIVLLEHHVNCKLQFDSNDEGQWQLNQIATAGHFAPAQLAVLKGMRFSWKMFPSLEKEFLQNGYTEISLKDKPGLREAFGNPVMPWLFIFKHPKYLQSMLVFFASNPLSGAIHEIRDAFGGTSSGFGTGSSRSMSSAAPAVSDGGSSGSSDEGVELSRATGFASSSEGGSVSSEADVGKTNPGFKIELE